MQIQHPMDFFRFAAHRNRVKRKRQTLLLLPRWILAQLKEKPKAGLHHTHALRTCLLGLIHSFPSASRSQIERLRKKIRATSYAAVVGGSCAGGELATCPARASGDSCVAGRRLLRRLQLLRASGGSCGGDGRLLLRRLLCGRPASCAGGGRRFQRSCARARR